MLCRSSVDFREKCSSGNVWWGKTKRFAIIRDFGKSPTVTQWLSIPQLWEYWSFHKEHKFCRSRPMLFREGGAGFLCVCLCLLVGSARCCLSRSCWQSRCVFCCRACNEKQHVFQHCRLSLGFSHHHLGKAFSQLHLSAQQLPQLPLIFLSMSLWPRTS